MQFKNIGFRVPGLHAAASMALTEAHMSTTAQQHREALAFWQMHGLTAAIDHAGICRSTLHAWRAAYLERGAAGLAGRNRAPKQTRAQLAAGTACGDSPAAQSVVEHGAGQVAQGVGRVVRRTSPAAAERALCSALIFPIFFDRSNLMGFE